MIESISAVIIVKNGGATIGATLDSLCHFSEVILYDNGSTDDTLDIASGYPNVVIVAGDFTGFGPTKQQAVHRASNDWVLSLDADEMVSKALLDYLQDWDVNGDPNRVGKVIRHNYFMGELVNRAGWGADWLVRLFNRQVHNFNDNKVHESVTLQPASVIKKVNYPINHNAVQNIGQFLEKVNRYSEIRRMTAKSTYPPSVIFLKALWRFFESYVLKGGFLCGWRGMVISWSNANGVFFKYMKIYADKNRDRRGK